MSAEARRIKQKRKKAAALSQKQARAGYWFILPWVIGALALFIVPTIISLSWSFSDVKISATGMKLKFAGFDNYANIFLTDENFIPAVLDSLKNILYEVPIIAFFSMFIAQILNQKFKGRTIARVLFFLPVIIASGAALEILTKSGMSTDMTTGGSENIFVYSQSSFLMDMLQQTGLSPSIISYLTGLIGKIFDITWKSGIQILLYLSALQGIPRSYYEVSSMEGATAWEEFWKITFPLLSPMTLVCVVYTIIDSFTYYQNQVIELIDMQQQGFQYGIASAMSWTYFVLILIILALVVKFIFGKAVYSEE